MFLIDAIKPKVDEKWKKLLIFCATVKILSLADENDF